MQTHGIELEGDAIDGQTRCRHYHSDRDIIAIRFACCGRWYPCYQCHEAHAGHPARRWQPARFDERAVLCGRCGHQLRIGDYLECDHACPACNAAFNPQCHTHHHLYFAL